MDEEMASEDRTNEIKKNDQLRLLKNDLPSLEQFFEEQVEGIAI